ncbi:type IV fimbrial biogenesis protein FimT [Franzmannia pantelleriensis]|uniref:Type II secretion system protein H n=1 Tax=Franzmannia pantelleriensis TaxID=48727 RepID=A0A1G9U4G6_9GAMM|nr:GspH/FimT family pseudopilin [Halomonas pantelleriensis]SDM54475.1 type IV fimbrial biogenesis protein FimT [Halomonas pantelleriensis]
MRPTCHQDYHETPAANRQRVHHLTQGFTLIELLVVIAVAVIIATWAIPSYQQFTARNQVAAEVMRIKTTLATARNTAITRRTTIAVCPVVSADSTGCDYTDWSLPLAVVEGQASSGNLSDATLLRILKGTGGPTVSFNRSTPIRYQLNGFTLGHNGTFEVCGTHMEGVKIIVSNTGRTRVPIDDKPTC